MRCERSVLFSEFLANHSLSVALGGWQVGPVPDASRGSLECQRRERTGWGLPDGVDRRGTKMPGGNWGRGLCACVPSWRFKVSGYSEAAGIYSGMVIRPCQSVLKKGQWDMLRKESKIVCSLLVFYLNTHIWIRIKNQVRILLSLHLNSCKALTSHYQGNSDFSTREKYD